MSTNTDYLQFRDWYCKPHYFSNRTLTGLREYYRYCFQRQTSQHRNASISRQAANDARQPWLSTTTRQRYYDNYTYLRKLRSISEDKERGLLICSGCGFTEPLTEQVTREVAEADGWLLEPVVYCPKHGPDDERERS